LGVKKRVNTNSMIHKAYASWSYALESMLHFPAIYGSICIKILIFSSHTEPKKKLVLRFNPSCIRCQWGSTMMNTIIAVKTMVEDLACI
jgi:hypothetical protein